MTVLLVVAVGLIDVLVFQSVPSLPTASAAVALGFMLGQIGALVGIVVLGKYHPLFVFLAVMALNVVFGSTALTFTRPAFVEWYCVLNIYAAALAIALAMRCRMMHRERLQFSIAEILSLTTIVAVFISSLAWMRFPTPHWFEVGFYCAAFPAVAFISIWAISGDSFWRRIPLVIASLFISSLIGAWICNESDFLFHLPMIFVYDLDNPVYYGAYPGSKLLLVFSVLSGTVMLCLRIVAISGLQLLPARRLADQPSDGVQMPAC